VTQSTSEQIDPIHDGGENGSAQHNGQALMVREHEMNGLMPYMAPPGYGSPYLDAMPAGLNFQQLLHALRRRWLLALIVGLLVGGPLAALLWLVTPENYEVAAWLRVGDPQQWGEQHRDQPEYEAFRKTQAARVRSPLVLQDVLNKEGIASLPMLRNEPEPEQFLEDEIIAVIPAESELLQIKMRGKDPHQLVKIVNAVKDSYIENVVQAENRNLKGRHDLLENTLNLKKTEIANKRQQLQTLETQTNSPDLDSVKVQENLLIQQSGNIMNEMSRVRDDLAKVMRQLAILYNQGDNPITVPQYLIEVNLSHDDEIAEYTKEKNQMQLMVEYAMAASRLKERDPQVKDYKSKLAGIEERLEQRRRELMPQIVKHLQMDLAAGDGQKVADPAQLEISKKQYEANLETLQKNLDDVRAKTTSLGNASATINGLQEEIRAEELERNDLQTQLDKVSLELQLPSRVVVLNDASVPEAPNVVLRFVVTIFAGFLGFVLGSGTIVGMEYQAHRLSSTGELSSKTGLRVLGTVPNLESLSRAKGLNGAAAMQGILAESIDSIRTMLLRQSRDDAPHVIMVTSAGDREGKTTVASHLAASLARSGRRTLLVDGDLRSPTVHAMFSAALDPGLCEILRGEVELEAAIQPTPVDGLMLIAAGACDYHAIASLSKELLTQVFDKTREQFEFVVIDAAPVLTYADTLLMGVHIDAAVLSVRRDVSQLHKVYEARERLESVGIKVLGAVVNGITETSRRPAYALPAPT
jgi:polysaccharide biosynthesis transport protein